MAKKWMTTLCTLLLALQLSAQDSTVVALPTVTTEASRVITKPDRMVFLPSEVTVAASHNALEVLFRLHLPGVMVDVNGRNVASVNRLGMVQVRIDGIEASVADLSLLPPQRVKNVQFIQRPGLRYGEGVQYVIDVQTFRLDAGYQVHTEGTQNLRYGSTQGQASVSFFRGKAMWETALSGGYANTWGGEDHLQAVYRLNNGKEAVFKRDADNYHFVINNQLATLKYSWVDSTKTQLQLQALLQRGQQPLVRNALTIMDDGLMQTGFTASSSLNVSPTVDVYFSHQFTARQQLTVNLMGSYAARRYRSHTNNGAEVQYLGRSRSWAALGEAIYAYQWDKWGLSVGSRWQQTEGSNRYEGDVKGTMDVYKSSLYNFVSVTGGWNKLSYTLGLSSNTYWYKQATHRFHPTFIQLKLQLNYALPHHFSVAYDFNYGSAQSQVAETNDVRVQQNRYEWNVGNPDLKPSKRIENVLSVQRSVPRWVSFFNVFVRNNPNCNLMYWERTEDDRFLSTQRNQRGCDMIIMNWYNQVHLVPHRLVASASMGSCWFDNRGDYYHHRFHSYQLDANVQWFVKRFTFTGYYASGWQFMEGEARSKAGFDLSFSASYRVGNWLFSLQCRNPFEERHRTSVVEVMDRYVYKRYTSFSRSAANDLSFTISYNLNKGRTRQPIAKNRQNKVETLDLLK